MPEVLPKCLLLKDLKLLSNFLVIEKYEVCGLIRSLNCMPIIE